MSDEKRRDKEKQAERRALEMDVIEAADNLMEAHKNGKNKARQMLRLEYCLNRLVGYDEEMIP